MKTQIIQLEPHDDAISVRDKMGWIQTGQVLLVWPSRRRTWATGRVLTRRLDLILLSRHSQTLGSQLALVTSDPEVLYNASRLGIPTYRSLPKAQESRRIRPTRRHLSLESKAQRPESRHAVLAEWVRPERTAPSIPPAMRLAVFALGVLAVLSLAAAIFPSAEITIYPRTEKQEIILTILAGEAATRVHLSGVLPMRDVGTIVEGRSSLPTSGSIRYPFQPASGTVTITNLSDRRVAIPAGMVVTNASGTLRYTTARPGTLPAGPGTTVDLPITAIEPGRSGNQPAGRIQAIEGDLGVSLAVTNLEPLSGGEDAEGPTATAADRAELRQSLISTLEQTAASEIERSLEPGDILINAAPTLTNVLEESYIPAQGVPASQIELSLRLEYQASYVSAADLTTLAEAVLDTDLQPGYRALPGTLQIEQLTDPEFQDDSTAAWRVRAARTIQGIPDRNAAVSVSLGQPPARAIQILDDLEVARSSGQAQVELHPGWWPVMPFLPFRITILDG